MTASTGARGIGVTLAAVALSMILPADARSYAQTQPSSALPELGKLRILYAGRPGSDREKDFVGFLKKYFDVVETGNLETFKETDTQGFDVTLLDWDWNDLQRSASDGLPELLPSGHDPRSSGRADRVRSGALKTGYL